MPKKTVGKVDRVCFLQLSFTLFFISGVFDVYSSSNSLFSILPIEKLYCVQLRRYILFKKSHYANGFFKARHFFRSFFFLKRCMILACVQTSPPLRGEGGGGGSAIRYGRVRYP